MKHLTLIVLLFFGLWAKAQPPQQLAVDFIYAMDSVPEKAYHTYLDTSFQNKIEVDQMVKMWGQIEMMFGDFQNANYICSDTTDQYIQVFATVIFKRKSQDLNISFNKQKKIIGFFMAQTIPCQIVEYPFAKYVKSKKVVETFVQFQSDSLTMYGSLTMPVKDKKNTPIFIFVHGSGPNDRDETIGPNKIFKDLAHGLATKGIPSLRYDKRTLVYKNPELSNTIQKEALTDVSSAIKWIKANPKFKNKPIYIIGHSLGAYLAPLIAQQNKDVKGIVMMAGNYRPMEDLILEQYNYLYRLDTVKYLSLKDEIQNMESKVKYLKNNLTENTPSDELPFGIPASYWLSMRNYDQKTVIQKLSIPILVLQGERDYQVTMTDYKLWKEVMANKPNFTAKSYEKLNHLFLAGEGQSNPTEYMTQSNVPGYVVKDILKWVKANK